MDHRKVRAARSALDIVGLIFAIIGGSFAAAGIIAAVAMKQDLHSYGYTDVDILPFIFLGMGLLFLVLGSAFLIHGIRKRARSARLVREGFYVTAVVRDIYPNETVRINGRSPFILECHYRDMTAGKTHIFKSDNVPFYPIDAIDTQIRVYVDPSNMDHYYVDISGLTDCVVIH